MNHKKLPFECVTLLLQGGGALGAYQAGVYQALSEAGLEPNWVAGISIGSINAAIIAGNAPQSRVKKLQEFWRSLATDSFINYPETLKSLLTQTDNEHKVLNTLSAFRSLMTGVSGFFKPHMIPWLEPKGSKEAVSFYDTSPLKSTLENLIDFDRLNNDDIRFDIGAVNVRTGNLTNFDNERHDIRPEHIMASSALPPGFPPIEVDGEYYWDAGLISNTPMHWVLQNKSYMDSLVFQVDLWSADGALPQNMAEVLTRQKDIQYSSRTRANTDRFREQHKLGHTIAVILEKFPEIKKSPEAKLLETYADTKIYNIVHLIYHNKIYEGYSKDFEFSLLNMEAHWESGYQDTIKALEHPQIFERPNNKEGIAIFDFSQENKLKKKSA